MDSTDNGHFYEPVEGELVLTETEEISLPAPPPSDTEWPWPHFPQNAKRNFDRDPTERFTGWEGDFLHAFRMTGVQRAAAQMAAISVPLITKRRKEDPVFRKAYEEARQDVVGMLEYAAMQRAVNGVERVKRTTRLSPDGKTTITTEERVREHSDTLLIFLLKANAPDKYRESIDHKHSLVILTEEARKIAREMNLDEDKVIEEALRLHQGGS